MTWIELAALMVGVWIAVCVVAVGAWCVAVLVVDAVRARQRRRTCTCDRYVHEECAP